MARHDVSRRAVGADAADELSWPSLALAVGHPSLSRDDFGRTQFRLRDRRVQSARRGSGRARSQLVASGLQRCRAGSRGDARTLCRPLRALRIRSSRAHTGVRARRVGGGAHLPAARPRSARRAHRSSVRWRDEGSATRLLRCREIGTRSRFLRSALAATTRSASSTTADARFRNAPKAASNFAGPPRRAATTGTRMPPPGCFAAIGSIRATSATSPAASSS